MNPMQLVQMAKGSGNPQQMVMQMLQNQMSTTPIGKNLLSLAKNGDSAGIEAIARNVCSQRGVDFDSQFAEFRKMFGA